MFLKGCTVADAASHPGGISIRFNRILLATDFSPASEKALPYVAAFARRFSSELSVAHVLPPHAFAAVVDGSVEAFAQQENEAERRINALLASAHFSDIPHRVLIEQGEVWPTLSRLAADRNVDLIAAGTRGPHGFEKFAEGSTAEEIERLSTRPVLLVGPQVTVDPQAELKIERILYATDFKAESRRSMEYAYALAKAYAAHLVILHVVDNPLDDPPASQIERDAFCRRCMAESKWPAPAPGVEPEFILEFGSPEQWTLDVIAQRDAQLVVLSTPRTPRPAFKPRLPGPLAYDVVTHARCPVLTIRAEGPVR
jgi:nucleotide-binding universal stress UspA family protein